MLNSSEAEFVLKLGHESIGEELRYKIKNIAQIQNKKYKLAEKNSKENFQRNKINPNKIKEKKKMPLPAVTVVIWNMISVSLPTFALSPSTFVHREKLEKGSAGLC